jgi:excisionase family DNA binding protein
MIGRYSPSPSAFSPRLSPNPETEIPSASWEGESIMTLLTQREAAVALRISERTLERLRCTGAGGPRFVRCGKRSIRYRQEDLDAYIASRVVGSTSEGRVV